MNGATTEHLATTISPPKIVISTSAGTSQTFFRASMNASISLRKDIEPSERFFERLRGRSSLAARDPVAFPARPAHSHRIDPERAHQQTSRHDGNHVHAAKEDRIGNLVQHQPELVPA